MAEEEEKPKGKRFTKEFVEKWSKTAEHEPPPEDAILEKQKKMLEEDPKNIKLWFARGRLLMDLNRNGEAFECLDKVTELDPQFPGAWNARAEVLRRLGRLDESAESLRRALTDVAPRVDERFRDSLEKKESVEDVLKAVTAEEEPDKAAPPPPGAPLDEPQPPENITAALEDLETINDEERPPKDETPEQKEFREKIKTWAAQGFDVGPLKEILAKEPYKARTAFFQFEQNVAKVTLLQETLDGIKTPGFQKEVERLRKGMKSPYNIWKVEADMGDLLTRVEESERSSGKAAAEEELRVISESPPAKDFDFEVAKPSKKAVKVSKSAGLRPSEGRVNGIAKAGRVNGLGGAGRVNGLAAAGRINGLAATGRVNGLVNGLQAAKRGMTNGLTNGSGFTNGLGSDKFRREVKTKRWKVIMIPAIAALLLFIPILSAPLTRIVTPPGGVTVDGDPVEWSGVPGYTQTQYVPDDNVNMTTYKLWARDGILSILVGVKGIIFSDNVYYDSLYAFVDIDGNTHTGYGASDSGADAMIQVHGKNMTVATATLSVFNDANSGGRENWTAWQDAGGVLTAISGAWIEFQIDQRMLKTGTASFDGRKFTVSLIMDNNRGVTSTSIAQMSADYGALIVRQKGGPQAVFGGSIEDLLTLEFEAVGGTVHVNTIDFAKSPKTTVADVVADFDVVPGHPTTKVVRVNTQASGFNDFLTLDVSAVDADRPVTITGDGAKAYVGSMPTNKRIDGIFADWAPGDIVADTDSNAVWPNRLDINRYGANRTLTNAFFYIDVRGRMMAGADAANIRVPDGPSQAPLSQPEPPKLRRGDDIMRIYIDSDSQDGAGTPVLGLSGADYMIDVRGRHGRITQRTLYRWANGWLASGNANAELDSRRMELGANLSGATIRAMQVAFEASSWRSVVDTTSVSSVRSRTRGADVTTYETMYDARLPSVMSAGGSIRYEARSKYLEWTLPSEIVLIDGEITYVLSELAPSAIVAGDSSAHYVDAYPSMNMDLVYLVEETALKEQFVIMTPIDSLARSSGGVIRFEFDMMMDPSLMVYLDGDVLGDLVTTTKRIAFTDGRQESFAIPPAVAWDSNGRSIVPTYTWDKRGPTLSMDLPVEYLRDASYPVYIDPWVNYTLKNTGPLSGGSEYLGNSVAVGDFNGDNYADLLAGAYVNDINGTLPDAGAAYIYFGPLDKNDSTPDVIIPGNITGYRKGYAVAAGKFNVDDYWDALVTQAIPEVTNHPSFIYYGRATWPLWVKSADVTINSQSNGGSPGWPYFGYSAAAGNVDNRFYDDVIIGAPRNQNAGVLAQLDGCAFLFMSPFKATVTSANFTLLPPTNQSGQFGTSIATGKIDSDSAYDIVIGEPIYSLEKGRASVFKGSSLSSGSGLRMPNQNVVGRQDYERFGQAVAVGKLNSDSYEDIAVGAPHNGPMNTYHGKVYLYLSWAAGITTGQAPNATVVNQSNGEQFGSTLLIGEVMNPGTYCLVVGAPYAKAGGTNRGSVYVFDSPLSSSTPVKTHSGSMNNEYLSNSLAGGKFSSDSFYRIAIGAYSFPGAGTVTGRVVILSYIPEFNDFAIVALSVLGAAFAIGRRRKRRIGT